MHGPDRPGDVLLIQAAGDDQRPREAAGNERPVEAFADAAVFGHEAVDQPRRGARIRLQILRYVDAGLDPARFNERHAELRAELRRLVAMELQHRRLHALQHLRDLRRIRVDEQRDRLHERRQRVANLHRALGREVARALRIEDEADGIGAGFRRVDAVARARDAADLDARSHWGSPQRDSYSTFSRYRPSAPKVGAALLRSFEASSSLTHAAGCLPLPT